MKPKINAEATLASEGRLPLALKLTAGKSFQPQKQSNIKTVTGNPSWNPKNVHLRHSPRVRNDRQLRSLTAGEIQPFSEMVQRQWIARDKIDFDQLGSSAQQVWLQLLYADRTEILPNKVNSKKVGQVRRFSHCISTSE